MIQFKRGNFNNGDTTGIVVPDFNEHSGDDLFLNPLTDDCWILTISGFRDEVELISGLNADFDFVPTEQDRAYDNYDMFWASELTIIFSSYDRALKFIRDYQGPYLEQLSQLYENLLNPFSDAEYV